MELGPPLVTMCTPLVPARPLCGLWAGAGLLVYITGAGAPLYTSPGGRVMPDIRDGGDGTLGYVTLEDTCDLVDLSETKLIIMFCQVQ